MAEPEPQRVSGSGWIAFANELQHIGRLHIVAIAAVAALTFGWAFTGVRPWLAAGFCALDWFLVNLLNRVVDLKEDRLNAIPGTERVARHRSVVLYGGIGLLVASFGLGALWVPAILPFRAAYHLLGFSYNWRLFGKVRLKAVYGFKNLASGTGFLLTCFAYPLAAAWRSGEGVPFRSDVGWAGVALTAGFFLLFELSYEIVYDLRDVRGDEAAGVPTFPVVHGVRGATKIIDGLLLTSSLLLLGGWLAGLVPWRLACMVIAPVLQVVLYKRWLARGIKGADCVWLTWVGAALLCAYHGWIALGLPGVGS
ncbi:MAG: UbiA family prenyltransferase [Planctomycetota bacterium]